MKKILGILVTMLLISITVLPTVSAPPTIDQSQENRYADLNIGRSAWQEFVPEMKILKMVEIRIAQWESDTPDLELTIEKPLGNILRSEKVPASLIPHGFSDWVMFDIPDIELTPGDTYVIGLTAQIGGVYSWGIGKDDPYPKGVSSAHPDDFCFRTWASNGKSRNSIEIVRERPFHLINWLLDQNLNLFPLLRQILGL